MASGSSREAGSNPALVDAGSSPAAVDTSKRGRKPLADPTPRQLYQRELMRKRRAAAKLKDKP